MQQGRKPSNQADMPETSAWTRRQFAAMTAPTAEWGHQPGPVMPLAKQYAGLPNRNGYWMGPGVDLAEADLNHADMRWSNLRGASLRGADLQQAQLCGARLINVDLRGADLRNADLTGADLVGADLSDADCTGASFLGARYSRLSTRFPRRFDNPEACGMIAVDAYQDIG